ncbi:MAG: hypothetical protein ISS74_05845 [Planctomycetes bacterium]|nr:hypothetical protein [Planctomycetota bacterium]
MRLARAHLLMVVLLAAVGPASAAEKDAPKPAEAPPIAITSVEVRPVAPRALERVDVDVQVAGGPFKNPDDPKEIDVRAEFKGPDGRTVSVPAFWYQPYRVDDVAKQVVPDGEPVFRVRYTPRVKGMYACAVRATAGKQEAAADPVTVHVLGPDAEARGFARLHPASPVYYQFERRGGTLWLAGANLDAPQFPDKTMAKAYATAGFCEVAKGITPADLYETYQWHRGAVEALAEAGATCVRLPLHSAYLPLEPSSPTVRIPGLEVGRYHAGNAWVADQVVRLCEARGLVVILVTWNFTSPLVKEGSVYAAVPASRPLVERRLRYQVARWAYSPAVLGWTLFDNARFRPTDYDYWKAVIATVRSLDPNGHFVFNTPYGVDQDEQAYLAPYGYPLAEFHKGPERPMLVSTYGAPERAERLALEGLWAAIAGHRSGALFAHAWHLGKAEALGRVYGPAAAFLKGEDLGACAWRPAYFDQVAGPGGMQYRGMVGDRRRAVLYFLRTSAYRDVPYEPPDGNVIRVGDFQPGAYTIQWWDPAKTEPVATQRVRVSDTTVFISLPDGIRWFMAAKIVPGEDGAMP